MSGACPGGCAQPGNPPGDPASLPVLPTGWLKFLRADYGSEGESGASLGSGVVGGRDRGTETGGPHQGWSPLASHHGCPIGWVGL